MKKNIYEELTNEELLKKKDLFKGVAIGFGIILMLVIGTVIYLFATKGFKNASIAIIIPVLTLPITFVPLLINLSLLNKEIKTRNI